LPLSMGPSSSISRQDITAYLCRKLQEEDRSISTRASYVAVRLSSVFRPPIERVPPTFRQCLVYHLPLDHPRESSQQDAAAASGRLARHGCRLSHEFSANRGGPSTPSERAPSIPNTFASCLNQIEPSRSSAALSRKWFGPKDSYVTEYRFSYYARGATSRSQFRGLDAACRRLCSGCSGRSADLMRHM